MQRLLRDLHEGGGGLWTWCRSPVVANTSKGVRSWFRFRVLQTLAVQVGLVAVYKAGSLKIRVVKSNLGRGKIW